ncbi:MAG: hypothetical protein JEY79_10545 [Pseudodesulfovibrio sp.]|nr:hypothetical protein [Pseudodesulfovibrio sp.]
MSQVYQCYACGDDFEYGPHDHGGEWLAGYEVDVCRTCYDGNGDGWSPQYEDQFLARIEELDIEEPERNDNDLLPREIRG